MAPREPQSILASNLLTPQKTSEIATGYESAYCANQLQLTNQPNLVPKVFLLRMHVNVWELPGT